MLDIGISLVKQLAGNIDHIPDMLRGQRIARGLFDPEFPGRRHELVDIFSGKLPKRQTGLVGPGDGVVVKIGNIHIGFDRQTIVLQGAGQQVGNHKSPAMRHIRGLIDRRSTGVESGPLLMNRSEFLLLSAHGIIKAQPQNGRFRFCLRDKKRGAKVPFTAVRQDGDNKSFADFAGQAESGKHGCTGTHAGKNSFLFRQQTGGAEGVFVADIDDSVGQRLIKNAWFIGLLHVLEPLDLMVVIGLNRRDADSRMILCKPLAESHGRAGRPHGGDHVSNLPCRLLPDLRPCLPIMGLPVGLTVELIGHKIQLRMLTPHGIGFFNGAVGAAFCRGQGDFRAIGLHNLPALHTGRFRHDELTAISPGGADHCQADAGIAAGCLQNNFIPI